MKLVLDLETTGLPICRGFMSYYDPKEFDKYDTSRIVQLAYIKIDPMNIEVKSYTSLIKPTDFKIENSHIHGITQEKAEQGKDFLDVLNEIKEDFKECDIIIGHNVGFDFNILCSESLLLKNEEFYNILKEKKLYCTMKESKKILNERKFLRLKDLNFKLFQTEWNQIHDALDDCVVCLKCYAKLIEF